MLEDGRSTRRMRERLEMSLPVRVHCRESEDHSWIEKTRLVDITPFGARLSIGHPTERGRLLHLTMPLPRQLRCFDYTQEQYNIWALVCHATPLVPGAGRLPRRMIGVAFIGQHPPLSFETDPTRRYEIAAAPANDNLWGTREQPRLDELSPDAAGERRAERRYVAALEVVIEAYDEEGNLFAGESNRTENISRRGMAVTIGHSISRGRFVRVRSERHDLAVIGAVRRLRTGADGLKRLHLEFLDQQWPHLEEG